MMKERTNPKSVAPHKVKGTVLFTVVCVMMVLIVFLMGALALAGTASMRASNTYSSTQTQATARAGVNAIIASMQNNVNIAKAAAEVNATNPSADIGEIKFGYMDTKYDEKTSKDKRAETYLNSLGKIEKSGIQYVGKKWEVDKEGRLVEKDVIKVWATATQGTAESTYAAYILKNAGISKGTTGESQGFITTGSAISANHTSVYGGAYIGFDEKWKGGFDPSKTNEQAKQDAAEWAQKWKDSLPKNKPGDIEYHATDSDGVLYETDYMVNGSFYNDTGTNLVLVVKDKGTGMTVWGDMILYHEVYLDTANVFTANYSKNPLSYKDIPYLYVEGDIVFNLNNKYIGPKPKLYEGPASQPHPFQIFCGSIQNDGSEGETNILGDVYCYDATKTSQLSSGKPTVLYQWGSAQIRDVDGVAHENVGGSFYSKGNLQINGDMTIGGDLCVDGNVEVKAGKLTVEGNIKVGGTFKANNNEVRLKNGCEISCDAVTGNGNIKHKDGSDVTVNPALASATKRLKSTVELKDMGYCVWLELYNYNNTGAHCYWMKHGYTLGNSATKEQFEANMVKREEDDSLRLVPVNVENGEYKLTSNASYDTTKVPKETAYVLKSDHTTVVSESDAFEYVDSNGNVITSKPSFFPDCMEKEVIWGERLPAGKSGDVDSYKIIRTVPDVLNSKSDPYAGATYVCDASADQDILDLGTDYKHASHADHPSWEYRASENRIIVTDSCTITGTRSDSDWGGIIVQASSDKEIWIKLKDFSLSAGYLIVDDTGTMPKNVNFFIEGHVIFSGSGSTNMNGYVCLDGKPLKYSTPAYAYLTCIRCVRQFDDKTPGAKYQIFTSMDTAKLASGYTCMTNKEFEELEKSWNAMTDTARADAIKNFVNSGRVCEKAIPYYDAFPDKEPFDPPAVKKPIIQVFAGDKTAVVPDKTTYDVYDDHGNRTSIKIGEPYIQVSNNTTVTAYVKAPYLEWIQSSSGGATPNSDIYYNNYPIKNLKPNQIGDYGCMIVKRFFCGNNWLMMFAGQAGEDGGSGNVTDALMRNWRILYYDNY